jgi:hypothetical protein
MQLRTWVETARLHSTTTSFLTIYFEKACKHWKPPHLLPAYSAKMVLWCKSALHVSAAAYTAVVAVFSTSAYPSKSSSMCASFKMQLPHNKLHAAKSRRIMRKNTLSVQAYPGRKCRQEFSARFSTPSCL